MFNQVEAWNGKKLEPEKQPGNKIRQKYRKYRLRKMEKDMKEKMQHKCQ